MSDESHPYSVDVLNYLYVLTILNDGTVRVDNLGYHQATAIEDIHTLECDRGYKVCFDYFSIEGRTVEAWDSKGRFELYTQEVPINTEFEPHKHPRRLRQPIKSGEQFEWFCKTSYHLRTPTREAIGKVRSQHWWDSNEKALLAFYHGAREIVSDTLSLYIPPWLASSEHSKTYEGFAPDGVSLDERILATQGLAIKRSSQTNADPAAQAQSFGVEARPLFPHWEKNYTKLSLHATGKSLGEWASSAVMTVGIISPPASEWKSNI